MDSSRPTDPSARHAASTDAHGRPFPEWDPREVGYT